MLVSMIGSRSTSKRTADRMESETRCPSWNCDWYHATRTSWIFLSFSLTLMTMTAVLINCKNWFCQTTIFPSFVAFLSLVREKEWKPKQQKMFIAKPTASQTLSTLGDWWNNFYDLKLILKHIIWIHFMVHSFITSDMCGTRARGRLLRCLCSLCLSYAENVYGI